MPVRKTTILAQKKLFLRLLVYWKAKKPVKKDILEKLNKTSRSYTPHKEQNIFSKDFDIYEYDYDDGGANFFDGIDFDSSSDSSSHHGSFGSSSGRSFGGSSGSSSHSSGGGGGHRF